MDQFQDLEDALNEHFGVQLQMDYHSPEPDEHSLVCDFSEEDDSFVVNDETVFERARLLMSDTDTIQDDCDNTTNMTDQDVCDIELKYNSECCSSHCLKQFEFNFIKQHVLNLRELLKTEKEMLIMGALKSSSSAIARDQRKRTRYEYSFMGKPLCFRGFITVYDTTRFNLQSLQAHIRKNGYVPRVHGNTGRKPPNAFSYEDIKNATQFLLNYAEVHGIRQPVGSRWQDASPPIYLPCGDTKQSIYKLYENACTCNQSHEHYLSLSSFKDLWSKVLPHIKISSPKTDVCHKCEIFRKNVNDAVNDDDKIEIINKFSDHLRRAQEGKDRYREVVQESVSELKDVARGYGPVEPLSKDYTKVHYTFDFSQPMTLPHHARQMGPLYFASPRKIQLFGVRLDGIPRQYNYLIDEDQTIGADGSGTHGPDTVISILHHAFENFGYGEKDCVVHADNCVGQNKNRYLMAYFSWRTQKRLHRQITYFMQIPGHTRCLVDSNFAHIKKLYRRTDSESLHHLREKVDNSSYNNHAVLFTEEPTWVWRDWKGFLGKHFVQINKISTFYSFRFHADFPGIVYVRENKEPEKAIKIIKEHLPLPDGLPTEIEPAGLTPGRQQYLFRHVRQFVREPWKDVTCPPPNVEE